MTVADVVRGVAALAIVGGLTALSACGGADDGPAAEPVAVTDVWARTTPPGTTVGAVYLTVTSDTADVLTGADVDPAIAASTVLHSSMTSASGETSMEKHGELDVPAGGQLVLEPAGNHLMLVDLADPLAAGETFELTLRFATAGDETVTVEVRDEAP